MSNGFAYGRERKSDLGEKGCSPRWKAAYLDCERGVLSECAGECYGVCRGAG